MEMRFEAADQVRWERLEETVTEFTVFEGSGVEGHGAVTEKGLDFGY